MSYNTVESFLLRAYPKDSFNDLDEDVVQNALDAAAEDINCALRPHHKLPLSYTPANILENEAVMASHRLLIYRGAGLSENDEILVNRYNEITAPNGWLDRLSKGLIIFESNIDATPTKNEGAPLVLRGAKRRVSSKTYDSDGNEVI